MIFVTVGTQLPFDRLVMTIDEWAGGSAELSVFAQIGHASQTPKNIKSAQFLSPTEAEQMFQDASLIISHAGMGSILSALKYKKPIIIMPRLASKGEHRNEHQLATAKWVADIDGINVAWNEKDLLDLLTEVESLKSGGAISDFASETLIQNLKHFIWDRRMS